MNQYKNYINFKKWDDFYNYSTQEKIFFNKIFRKIDLNKKIILDVGFGRGHFLKYIEDRGGEAHGIEYQNNLIEIVNKAGCTKVYKNLNGSKLKFDIIVFFNVIEHIEFDKIKNFLATYLAYAKSSATIVMTFPNCQSPAGLINQFGDPTHKSLLSGPIVQKILEDLNLVNIAYVECPIQQSKSLPKRFLKKITWPLQLLSKILFKITYSVGNAPLSPDVLIFAKTKIKT
jgi:hypothetical protein